MPLELPAVLSHGPPASHEDQAGGPAAPSRALLLLLPLAVSAVLWLLVLLAGGPGAALSVLGAAVAAVIGGTSVIFGPAVVPDLRLSTWELAGLVVYVNGLLGFLYAYNLDLLERLPGIGTSLRRARTQAVANLGTRPWIRRLATVGVGLFVLTPLPGSGSLGGCVLGRLIGLSARRSFAIVTVAGAIVAVGYALAGDALGAWLDAGEVRTSVRVAGAVAIVALLWVGVRLLRRLGAADPPAAA